MNGQLQNQIVKALECLGVASPREVADWCNTSGVLASPVSIRQALRRLHARGLVSNHGYGRYLLSPDIESRVETPDAWARRAIHDYLLEVGGIAKKSEINRAFDSGANGFVRDSSYKLVTRTLARWPEFRQDFGHGVWNLPAEEREVLPLTGYWATYRVLRHDDSAAALESAAVYFRQIGTAFAAARNCFIDELVECPDVRNQLDHIAAKSPHLVSRLRDGGADLLKDGVPYDDLYAAFEGGDFAAHLGAPAEFYRVCGKRFSVSAAQLSRGCGVLV